VTQTWTESFVKVRRKVHLLKGGVKRVSRLLILHPDVANPGGLPRIFYDPISRAAALHRVTRRRHPGFSTSFEQVRAPRNGLPDTCGYGCRLSGRCSRT